LSGPNFIHLQNLLLYHVLPIEFPSSKIFTDITVGVKTDFIALNGDDIVLRTNKNDKIFADENRVITVDTEADNGVVHTVEGVLLPPWADTTILDVVGATPELAAVNGLMNQVPTVVEILNGPGPFTVFAPSSSGIQSQLAALAEMGIGTDPTLITSMLNYHVVEGIYPASAISDGLKLLTLQGGILMFEVEGASVKVDELPVISVDILANNGIIHLIDGVLLPDTLSGIGV